MIAPPSIEKESMVNGLIELVVILVIATVGGVCNGVLHYSGSILPRRKRKNIPAGNGESKTQYVLVLGVLGNTLLGTLSGFLVYMLLLWNSPLLQAFPHAFTGQNGFLAFFGGFSGTFLIDKGKDWFEKQSVGALMSNVPHSDPDFPILQNLRAEPRTSVAMMHLK